MRHCIRILDNRQNASDRYRVQFDFAGMDDGELLVGDDASDVPVWSGGRYEPGADVEVDALDVPASVRRAIRNEIKLARQSRTVTRG